MNASVPSPQRAAKLRERLLGAFVSLERERYAEARRIGNQLARELTDVAAVHELIGLANYRLGEWRKAAAAMLARKHAPQRVNFVAGEGEHVDATLTYLVKAPGVTGQYLQAAS